MKRGSNGGGGGLGAGNASELQRQLHAVRAENEMLRKNKGNAAAVEARIAFQKYRETSQAEIAQLKKDCKHLASKLRDSRTKSEQIEYKYEKAKGGSNTSSTSAKMVRTLERKNKALQQTVQREKDAARRSKSTTERQLSKLKKEMSSTKSQLTRLRMELREANKRASIKTRGSSSTPRGARSVERRGRSSTPRGGTSARRSGARDRSTSSVRSNRSTRSGRSMVNTSRTSVNSVNTSTSSRLSRRSTTSNNSSNSAARRRRAVSSTSRAPRASVRAGCLPIPPLPYSAFTRSEKPRYPTYSSATPRTFASRIWLFNYPPMPWVHSYVVFTECYRGTMVFRGVLGFNTSSTYVWYTLCLQGVDQDEPTHRPGSCRVGAHA